MRWHAGSRRRWRAILTFLGFVLVALFVFSTLILGFLTTLTGAICDAATDLDCQLVLQFPS